jgi:hypothetical protein
LEGILRAKEVEKGAENRSSNSKQCNSKQYNGATAAMQ